jgi:amino acid adenylation domain-containing protein
MKEYRDERVSFSFKASEDVTARFEEFYHRHEASPVMALSALVGILLYRYSGEARVPLKVRSKSGIGFSELAVNLEECPTVGNLLHQAGEKMEGIDPPTAKQDRAANDWTIEFVFPRHLMRPLMRVVDAESASDPQRAFALICERNGIGLGCTFHYDASLYDDRLIAQMSGHLQNLLNEMMRRENSRCADLQMLSPEEINKIVYEENGAPLEYEPQCFQELYDEQVERNPDFNILFCENQTLTYGQLNSSANAVALRLREMGTGPEAVIGIGMRRSLNAIAGIVGALKTGAAYCAISPDYPLVRIEEMVKDAGVTVILTNLESADRFSMSGARVINIEDLLQDGYSGENITCKVKPENAAYVTFTSGSTGKPKGVIGTHRGLAVLKAMVRIIHPDATPDVRCLSTPLGFSTAAVRLLNSLCWGWPLAVIPDGQEKDPLTIAQTVQKYNITELAMMPSLLRQILTLGSEGKKMLRCVKRVGLTGAEITQDLVAPFRQMMPDASLTAGYVSSEICAVAFGNYVDLEGTDGREKIPLGRPGRGSQVLILDRNLNPMPIGAPGEMYVGSDYLARGYIGQPALTAERFLPNPFGRSPGARMFRTGDIMKLRFDGKIEFWGRCDNQVKIRGFRVELEEIESALMNYEIVKEAAVVAEKNEISERLVAYVALKGESNTNRLRQYLEQRLPAYMVPSIFVVLDHLPLTENGKIDRNSLPSAFPNSIAPGPQHQDANNPIQEDLIKNWETLIGSNNIGIHDVFLDLGGDSLIAAMIAMHIRERYGVEIPLMMFFEDLTIATLTDEISRLQKK